jgi:hypothetical protein
MVREVFSYGDANVQRVKTLTIEAGRVTQKALA